MSETNSYRRILRSSSVIGGASIVNILVGLLRTKVAAVLLGPSGIGLIGLLQNLMGTASVVSALGFGTAGTRQIAEVAEREDARSVAVARRALFWGTLLLSLSGGGLFWLCRVFLAERVLHGIVPGESVGWLGVGVALTVAAGSQTALLNGMQRIGDLARVSISTSILSTMMGLGALWVFGQRGILLFVLAIPMASFVCGHWYVAKLPRLPRSIETPLPVMIGQWKSLARIGSAFMIGGLVELAGLLVVRLLVERELGSAALGHFQASWMIAMTYIGFVLGAMGTDFYPRLSARMHDPQAANRLVNEQTEMALLLASPVVIAMLGLAPWIIEMLYSSEFAEAALIFRWQVIGDVLKVAAWPLAFVMLAAGDGRAFIAAQTIGILVFIAATWLGLRTLGVQATGVAFLCMYVAYLPLLFWLARRRTGFAFTARICWLLLVVLGTAVCVFIVSAEFGQVGAFAGLVAAGFLAVHAGARISHMAELTGVPGTIGAACRRLMIKAGVWRE